MLKICGLMIAIILLVTIVVAPEFFHLQIPNTGEVVVVNLTADKYTIEWGKMYNGQSKDANITLTSISNVYTTLYMTTGEWSPVGIDEYMTLVWNREGYLLAPKESVYCILTLSIDENIPSDFGPTFSLTITFTAWEVNG